MADFTGPHCKTRCLGCVAKFLQKLHMTQHQKVPDDVQTSCCAAAMRAGFSHAHAFIAVLVLQYAVQLDARRKAWLCSSVVVAFLGSGTAGPLHPQDGTGRVMLLPLGPFWFTLLCFYRKTKNPRVASDLLLYASPQTTRQQRSWKHFSKILERGGLATVTLSRRVGAEGTTFFHPHFSFWHNFKIMQ